MMPVTAYQPLPEHKMEEELSDKDIRDLLNMAASRLRPKAGSQLAERPFKLPKMKPKHVVDTHENLQGKVTHLDPSALVDKEQQALASCRKKIDDSSLMKRQKKQEEKKATAGAQWFNMPKTELTPELRRDLQLLKMRNVLDPKRHYKKDTSKSDIPAYSQVGTIIEGASEFYSGRIAKKDRRQTILEEVITKEQESGRFQRKYNEISVTKASGKKGFYKALKAKRSKSKIMKP